MRPSSRSILAYSVVIIAAIGIYFWRVYGYTWVGKMSREAQMGMISVGCALLLIPGALGMWKKGRQFRREDLARADYILSIGQFGSGLIILGYLLYVAYHGL